MVCAAPDASYACIVNNQNVLPGHSRVERLNAFASQQPAALLLVLALWLQPIEKDPGIVDE
jgi:hypothetical protein